MIVTLNTLLANRSYEETKKSKIKPRSLKCRFFKTILQIMGSRHPRLSAAVLKCNQVSRCFQTDFTFFAFAILLLYLRWAVDTEYFL